MPEQRGHGAVPAQGGAIHLHEAALHPAAVGVDIGCGMMAVRTGLRADQLPDGLGAVRGAIERAVPHGRSPGKHDRGAWQNPPEVAVAAWRALEVDFTAIVQKHPAVAQSNHWNHMGTLGTGNHFIELARKDMERWFLQLPDRDLAYFPKGSEHFGDYVFAVD